MQAASHSHDILDCCRTTHRLQGHGYATASGDRHQAIPESARDFDKGGFGFGRATYGHRQEPVWIATVRMLSCLSLALATRDIGLLAAVPVRKDKIVLCSVSPVVCPIATNPPQMVRSEVAWAGVGHGTGPPALLCRSFHPGGLTIRPHPEGGLGISVPLLRADHRSTCPKA